MKLAYGMNEAAKSVGVSRWTIWRMVRDGELQTTMIRNRKKVLAESLIAMLERGRAKAEAKIQQEARV